METTTSNPQPWRIDNLAKALDTAIAVELFTIPIYLSAATSIKEEARSGDKAPTITATIHDGNGGTKQETFNVYDTIMSVAVQEMFHLTMACNLANAMGYRPNITAPDLNNPPSCLKGIIGMPVKGNLNSLIDTMLAIEAPDPKYHYPESPEENPTELPGPTMYQEQYNSIGDLYHAIAFGVKDLWDYKPKNNFYQKTNFKSKYPEVDAVITSLEAAYNAISCITEQGEGNGSQYGFMPDAYVPGEGQQFQELDEIDHWERFNYIKQYITENGPDSIPQYSENHESHGENAQTNLTQTYSRLINQLNEDFKTAHTELNLRGMADTGTLATNCWKAGEVPQWEYISNPTPWPAPPKYPHSCQGLNSCKNQGASGHNDCAGAGTCATAVDHSCQYTNSCKLQGGCGYPGRNEAGESAYNPNENTCANNGGCQSPISPKQYYNSGEYAGQTVWDVARKLFTERYEKDTPDKTLKPVGEVTARRNAVHPTSPKKKEKTTA